MHTGMNAVFAASETSLAQGGQGSRSRMTGAGA